MIKKLLFASDFSSGTSKAEDYAASIAGPTQAEVTVIHAVEPIEVDDGSEDDTVVTRFLERQQASARKSAEQVAARFRAKGLTCSVEVPIGKRWKAIVDHAAEGGYDLVVIGAHNIHDGDKVYMGTTTQKVFFATDLPLLVVPS